MPTKVQNPEKTYHSLFEIGILLKALISALELIAGLTFAFISYDSLRQMAFTVFGGELMESPRDFVWDYLARAAHSFSGTPQAVWAFIFLSHGIVKILLITALWKDKLWAYPASAVVFTLFVVYQLYQLTFTPSIFLWLITILDIAVIALILHEYKHKRHGRIAASSPAQE